MQKKEKLERILKICYESLPIIAVMLLIPTISLYFEKNQLYLSYRLLNYSATIIIFYIYIIGALVILIISKFIQNRILSKESKISTKKDDFLRKNIFILAIQIIIVVLLSLLYISVIFLEKYKPILDYFEVSLLFGLSMGCLMLFYVLTIFNHLYSGWCLKKHPSNEKRTILIPKQSIIVMGLIFLFIPVYGLLGFVNKYTDKFEQNFSILNSFTDNFEDEINGTNPSHWMENNEKKYDLWRVEVQNANKLYKCESQLKSDEYTLLHVFGKAIRFRANITITNHQSHGGIWMLCRWNNVKENIQIGYNFASEHWEIREQKLNRFELRTIASKKGIIENNNWYSIEVIVVGSSVGLYIDNEFFLSGKCDHITYGQIGFLVENCSMSVDNVEYSGEGKVQNGVYQVILDQADNSIVSGESEFDLVELTNGSLILRQFNTLFRSNDGGITWVYHHIFEPAIGGRSILYFPSGTLVCVGNEKNSNLTEYRDFAILSYDGGDTWSEKHYIQSDYQEGRSTMNNKLVYTSTGRIFFTTPHKNYDLKYSGVRNYYSDDEGITWFASETALDWETWQMNLQEGKVYELANGTLRTMMRTDLGTLYESNSHDGGKTWDQPHAILSLISVRCAFNIERDPITGDNYVFWTYENTNKSVGEQYPRERIALAVLPNGSDSWQYVMDVDDWEDHWYSSRYVNLGLKVTQNHIFLFTGCFIEGDRDHEKIRIQKMWRVDRSQILFQPTFPDVHPNDPIIDSWQLFRGDLLI